MSDSKPSTSRKREQNLVDDEEQPKKRERVDYDAIVAVGGQKFEIWKANLSFHSKFFKKLFSNCPSNGIIHYKTGLEKICKEDFALFLELIDLKDSITDQNVENLLKLCKNLESDSVMGRLQEFLIYRSKIENPKKFEISLEYKLEELMEKAISNVSTPGQLAQCLPQNLPDLDKPILALIIRKSLELFGLPYGQVAQPASQNGQVAQQDAQDVQHGQNPLSAPQVGQVAQVGSVAQPAQNAPQVQNPLFAQQFAQQFAQAPQVEQAAQIGNFAQLAQPAELGRFGLGPFAQPAQYAQIDLGPFARFAQPAQLGQYAQFGLIHQLQYPSSFFQFGQTYSHYEQVSQLLGQAAQLLGQAAQPLGQAAQPLGHAAQPLGQAAQPHGQAAQPLGQAAQPLGHAAQPLGQAAQPLGQAAQTANLRLVTYLYAAELHSGQDDINWQSVYDQFAQEPKIPFYRIWQTVQDQFARENGQAARDGQAGQGEVPMVRDGQAARADGRPARDGQDAQGDIQVARDGQAAQADGRPARDGQAALSRIGNTLHKLHSALRALSNILLGQVAVQITYVEYLGSIRDQFVLVNESHLELENLLQGQAAQAVQDDQNLILTARQQICRFHSIFGEVHTTRLYLENGGQAWASDGQIARFYRTLRSIEGATPFIRIQEFAVLNAVHVSIIDSLRQVGQGAQVQRTDWQLVLDLLREAARREVEREIRQQGGQEIGQVARPVVGQVAQAEVQPAQDGQVAQAPSTPIANEEDADSSRVATPEVQDSEDLKNDGRQGALVLAQADGQAALAVPNEEGEEEDDEQAAQVNDHAVQADRRTAQAQGHAAQAHGHVAQARGHVAQAQGHAAQIDDHTAQADRHAAQTHGHVAQVDGHVAQDYGQAAQAQGHAAQDDGQAAQVQGQVAQANVQAAQANGPAAQVDGHVAQGDEQVAQAHGHAAQADEPFALVEAVSSPPRARRSNRLRR
ncbi:hypothetical protein B9Z55_007866 [Caenorhabditis nigoni]|uniref:BTB domain-containing protein n=1 Tax=Caenorhabditis nigoni TaxID=1611254 RepID=A0A2G5VBP3_9PELO|nr:hypothetical protein B9Z55_007866 [Caenorhabditis nigoni]